MPSQNFLETVKAVYITRETKLALKNLCRAHPDILLYGETFGHQCLKYGAGPNDFFFAAFDIMDQGRWLDYDEALEMAEGIAGFKWVPLVYAGPFHKELLLAEAEKNSLWPGCTSQKREGIVIRPRKERTDPSLGRLQLKMVSNRYLSGDK